MRTVNQEVVTRNLLQFCYTCEDAHLCTTEEACEACWAAKGLLDLEEENGAEETRALLFEYYA
ncbi:hypothetical protein [Paenibacillus sp. YPG26]|uniref:hypothetical protein n=1 Tax=Paenibacillus sp. YPG26 TaxID=2878915 RepID=UPI002041BD1E|nr:hypothetical protein [Paenibacillus sp. YPG26]USB33553.1 hypothetical protein LDO05_01615 [Paenibacillus sp. YPG26]